MWIIWRLLPICVIGLAIWRLVPAFGSGMSSLGRGNALTSINAAKLANALQGELGAAMEERRARPSGGVMRGQSTKIQLDGWSRPYEIKQKSREVIEVVSCGADGRCGTNDDIIELVRADGSRKRIDPAAKKPKKAAAKAQPKATKPRSTR